MEIEKLIPATKDYLWGGTALKTRYGLGNTPKVAEAWMLSFHPDGECVTAAGVPIGEAASSADRGSVCKEFPFFPSMVKLIDAADNLSVQVHPSDEYALRNEGQFGKTEMWYIVDAAEGAGIYLGFVRNITADEYARAIADGNLTDLLRFVPVKKGDCYFIPAGTVHAIGKGCLIAEVQQNSNLTYRVFDYNRVGADGKPRALHVEKAIAVSDLRAYEPQRFSEGILATCPYFTTRLVKGGTSGCRDFSYTSLVVLDGEGTVCGMPVRAGESVFVPAGKEYRLEGNITVLETYTPQKTE